MNRKNIYWMTSLLLSFLGFLIIEHPFTINPHTISGNGNLGIVVIFIFSPVFITSYILTFKHVRDKLITLHNRKINARILTLSLILCAILIAAIIHYTNDLITALGGDPTNPESRIYRFGWFNQYTNSLFFNVYTFLISHIFTVMLSVLAAVKYRKN
ncbi:MAG: hypothetical protein ABGX20_23135 [Bacillus sp. (in: firmicutes)]